MNAGKYYVTCCLDCAAVPLVNCVAVPPVKIGSCLYGYKTSFGNLGEYKIKPIKFDPEAAKEWRL